MHMGMAYFFVRQGSQGKQSRQGKQGRQGRQSRQGKQGIGTALGTEK
jgi:hypothetical protein